jgi:NDP-sugar pyrophosphorylase family protein
MTLIPGINNVDLFGIPPDADTQTKIEKWLSELEYPWVAIHKLDEFVQKIIQEQKDFVENNLGQYPWGLKTFNENGCNIEPGTFVEGFAKLGKKCTIENGAYLKGNICVGDNCVIESGVRITGNVVIGNNSHLHHGATITGCSKDGPMSVYISDNVDIYQNAIVKASVIMLGAKIFSGSYVPVSIIGPNARVGSQNSFDDMKVIENQMINIHYKLESIPTDLTRLGVIIGANTKLESGVTSNPGTIIGPNQIIPRNETIQGLIGMEK